MIWNSTVITIRTFIISEPFSVAGRGLRRDGEGFTTSEVDWSDYIVRYLQGFLCTSFNVMIKVLPIERRFIESFLVLKASRHNTASSAQTSANLYYRTHDGEMPINMPSSWRSRNLRWFLRDACRSLSMERGRKGNLRQMQCEAAPAFIVMEAKVNGNEFVVAKDSTFVPQSGKHWQQFMLVALICLPNLYIVKFN